MRRGMTLASGPEETFAPLLLRGVGLGLIFVPLTNASMAEIKLEELAQGTGMFNLTRQLGGSLGIAVMGAVVATQITVSIGNPRYPEQFVSGYHDALYVGAAITLGAAFIAASFVRQVRHQESAVRHEPEPAGTCEAGR